ncbi:MAG: lysostaphin resistance A-like protein [Planctomycetota bacterium]|jgi:membrane protease YdiL (CAAX protease family)
MVTYNRRGEVRLFWKLAAFVGLTFAAFVIFGIATSLLTMLASDWASEQFTNAFYVGSLACTLILVSWACLTIFDKRALTAIGFWQGTRTVTHLVMGTMMGAALVGTCWALIVFVPSLGGSYSISKSPSAARLTELVVLMLGFAILEEQLFRGYGYQLIARWNMPMAYILPGVLFSLYHSLNQGAWEPLALINVFIAHIMFAAFFQRTRSLVWPIGIHFGWNLCLGPVLGMTVSGMATENSWMTTTMDQGLLTGGVFGLESGLLATLVLLAAIGIAWLVPAKRPEWPDLAIRLSDAHAPQTDPA